MEIFWKDIKNKYSVDTYQDTKNTYDWIAKAINKGNFDCDEVRTAFLFNLSSMLCSCNGIEEFAENAYGHNGYKLVNMRFSFWPKDLGHVSIEVNNNCISVSTTTKLMMEKIVVLLEGTSLDDEEADDSVSVTYIKTQINNDGVIIKGDHNTVANNHSEIELEKNEKESGFKKFWAGVLQNITSNLVWYFLTLAVGFLLAYCVAN